jgi:hypothetical protein
VKIRTRISQFCEKKPLVPSRETKEGWPLLAVETDVNGDSKSANERGPSLVGSMGSSCQYTRFFSAVVGQIQNNFQFLCDAAFYGYFLEFLNILYFCDSSL